MILDKLDNAMRYGGLHFRFRQAFDWLRKQNLAALPLGRNEIDGGALYASVMRENGRGQAAARHESHRRYIDIQYLVEGSDLMGWAHQDGNLKSLGYDSAKDLEFYADPPRLWVPVPTGHFVIFFPEDAHAPLAGTGPMLKVVVKVEV